MSEETQGLVQEPLRRELSDRQNFEIDGSEIGVGPKDTTIYIAYSSTKSFGKGDLYSDNQIIDYSYLMKGTKKSGSVRVDNQNFIDPSVSAVRDRPLDPEVITLLRERLPGQVRRVLSGLEVAASSSR